MRSLLARLSGTPRAGIKILPDCDYVFVNGHGEEARGQYLRGKVILTVAKGESVKGVQLRMTKNVTLGHHSDSSKRDSTQTTMHQWDPFLVVGTPSQSNMHSISYEWSFELLIPGDQEETFKGCRLCSIGYRLEASTLGESPSQSDTRTFAPIRIIRGLPMSCYELMDPATSHGKWDTKAEYSVSIRHQAITLGGLIPVDVQLATLGSEVEVTKARFQLRESHIVHEPCSTNKISTYMQKTVEDWPLHVDNPSKESHSWQQCLHLPRIVNKCSPDFSIRGMSVSHTLHFAATLLKDGVDLEYETAIPVTLFVSPELPISGWDIFSYDHEQVTKEVLDALADGIRIPPRYCKGDFDYESICESVPSTPPPAYTKC